MFFFYILMFYIISVLVIDLIGNQLIISFGYIASVISASVFLHMFYVFAFAYSEVVTLSLNCLFLSSVRVFI